MKSQGAAELPVAERGESNILWLPPTGRCASKPSAQEPLTPILRQRVGVLRDLLAKSRLEGDNDLEGAYARLASEPNADGAAFGVTLFHTLAQATDRRLEFFCRICPKASEDELWLLRLIDSLHRCDIANVDALIGFRVRKEWRRRIRFLAAGLAARIGADYAPRQLANASSVLNVAP